MVRASQVSSFRQRMDIERHSGAPVLRPTANLFKSKHDKWKQSLVDAFCAPYANPSTDAAHPNSSNSLIKVSRHACFQCKLRCKAPPGSFAELDTCWPVERAAGVHGDGPTAAFPSHLICTEERAASPSCLFCPNLR